MRDKEQGRESRAKAAKAAKAAAAAVREAAVAVANPGRVKWQAV